MKKLILSIWFTMTWLKMPAQINSLGAIDSHRMNYGYYDYSNFPKTTTDTIFAYYAYRQKSIKKMKKYPERFKYLKVIDGLGNRKIIENLDQYPDLEDIQFVIKGQENLHCLKFLEKLWRVDIMLITSNIPDEILNNKKIVDFYLESKYLPKNSQELNKMQQLINLTYQSSQALPNSIYQLNNLRGLTIETDPPSCLELSDSLANMTSLERIEFHNTLCTLSEKNIQVLSKMKNLKVIWLGTEDTYSIANNLPLLNFLKEIKVVDTEFGKKSISLLKEKLPNVKVRFF